MFESLNVRYERIFGGGGGADSGAPKSSVVERHLTEFAGAGGLRRGLRAISRSTIPQKNAFSKPIFLSDFSNDFFYTIEPFQ